MKSFTHQVLDWVRSQPPEKKYDYYEGDTSEGEGCALCQFLVANGYARNPVVGGFRWLDESDGVEHPYTGEFADALGEQPWTFGALAERLAQ